MVLRNELVTSCGLIYSEQNLRSYKGEFKITIGSISSTY